MKNLHKFLRKQLVYFRLRQNTSCSFVMLSLLLSLSLGPKGNLFLERKIMLLSLPGMFSCVET